MARLIGTKDFYRKTLRIAMPIMIQNAITNFVGMLDNIMVGRIGTDAMSGVAIVNQLLFIYNLCIFGGLSGIGIFTAQYYGSGDEDGIRDTVRLQVLTAIVITAVSAAVLLLFSDRLIMLYLHSDGGIGTVEGTFRIAKDYLWVMYAGLLPFAFSQVYANTLRHVGETVIPMYAGVAAVLINLVGNYVLIFGKFGAPAMGAVGAALATVISRFAELVLVVGWTHLHTDLYPFIRRVYSGLFSVPVWKTKQIIIKMMPLLVNETVWSGAMATLNQCYSVRGLSVVAATNISSTVSNVFNVSLISMGGAIAIMVGQRLGAGEVAQARDEAGKLTLFSVLLCVAVGVVMFVTAPLFPKVYNTSEDIRSMARSMIRCYAVFIPLHAYCNACYFILRSGGKTFTTFLFDSVCTWLISVPTAWVLANLTQVPILWMLVIVLSMDLFKCLIGWRMVASGKWAQNLTA